MAVGGAEFILIIMLLYPAGGGMPNDLGSFLEPADYFNSRRIEAQPKSLLELASKPAPGAEASAAQLLAIRWLADNKDKLGDDKDAVRKALQKLAEGPAGFARDHATLA